MNFHIKTHTSYGYIYIPNRDHSMKILFNFMFRLQSQKILETKPKHDIRKIKKSTYINNKCVLLISVLMFKMFY